jgi:hypothetical protein
LTFPGLRQAAAFYTARLLNCLVDCLHVFLPRISAPWSRLHSARRWDDAVAQARKLRDMTLPRGNPYEQLDASGLLYALLYQQGQYAQAVLQTDQMMALASAEGYDPVSGQMQALIQRLTAAMMAGDQGASRAILRASVASPREQTGPSSWPRR